MSYILHIDTSAPKGLIGIAKEGILVAKRANEHERDQASTINLHIEATLEEASISMKDLDAVAVIGGPGSYTGLRIGLATAKGMCYALGKPLLLYNRLDLMFLLHARKDVFQKYHYYVSLLPARQDEYFVAIYNNNRICTVTPRHIHKNELEPLLRSLSGRILLIGLPDGVSDLKESSESVPDNSFGEHSWYNKAYEDYHGKIFTDIASATPFYLKEVYITQPKSV